VETLILNNCRLKPVKEKSCLKLLFGEAIKSRSLNWLVQLKF
jgi:hypothetical protein